MEREVPVSLVTTRGIHRNSTKLQPGRFRMDSRKNFITFSGQKLEQASKQDG